MKQPQSNHESKIANDILNGLRAIDKDILKGVPLNAALEGACRSVVEIFGLKLCWVGLRQEGSPEVAPVASWGFEEGYLSSIRVTCDESEHGRGPTGTAIRTRRPVVCNDTREDPAYRHWREEALRRGYQSSAAFPMAYNGNVVGALNVYSAEPNFFDQKRVELIQAFADQAAVSIRNARDLEALKESETKYRGLVDAANDAIISTDSDGRILLWNPAAERIFGYTAEEAQAQEFFTFIVPEGYRERYRRAFEEARKTRRLKRDAGRVAEFEGLRRDGTTFPLEYSVSSEDTPKGIRFTAILRDITKRKKMEAASWEAKELLERMFSSIELMVAYMDADLNFIRVNRAYAEADGRNVEFFVGKNYFELYPNAENEAIFRKVMETGEPSFAYAEAFESAGHPERGVTYKNWSLQPVKEADGSVHGLVLCLQDVTERELAVRALRDSEERYRLLFERNLAGVFRSTLNPHTLESQRIDCNDAYARILGYATREELLGQPVAQVFLCEADWKAYANRLLEHKSLTNFEVGLRRKDGKPVWVLANVSLREVGQGAPLLIEGTLIDITERKRFEAVIQESERKFRDLAERSLVGIYLIQDEVYKYVNPKFAEIFGYTVGEVMDKKGPQDLVQADDWPIYEDYIRRRISGELEQVHSEFKGVRKDGGTFYCEYLGSRTIYQGRPAVIGTLQDITERKRREEELKRRLMKFMLEDRKLYLVKEPVPTLALEAFKDLLKAGYRGLVISRTTEEEFKGTIGSGFEFLWISEHGLGNTLPPNLEELEHKIKNLPSRSAVLVDRLDYLIFKNSFENTLSFVQHLKEYAYRSGLIGILSIDPSTLDKRELRLLEKEAAEVAPLQKAKLPEDLLEILRFVYEQNASGIKPSYSGVAMRVGASKPTVRKRIKLLISDGYMIKAIKGRTKVVELTEMGKRLF